MLRVSDFILDGISNLYEETMNLKEPFIDFASRFANDAGTVVLLSSNNTNCGKYNILGCFPWLHFFGKNNKIQITVDGNIIKFDADPLEILRELLNNYSIDDSKYDLPLVTGLLGYISYDLKDHLKKFISTTIDDNHLPDICFFLPSIIVVNSLADNSSKLFVSSSKSGGIKHQKKSILKFKKRLNDPLPLNKNFSITNESYKSNLTHNEYVNAIKKIKQYITEGDVYQVNMSQRFIAAFEGDSFSFFKTLYTINPAPFFAYINAEDHKIISSSPERLIMQNQRNIETRPIKGTRPRGKTPKIDKLMKEKLLSSHKDDAELSMIVDLLRNDLGKVCRADSINIYAHKRLETYNNVYHLVSIIQGKLDSNYDSIDLIKAVFPGGSITGCPKIRAMEIIDELEVNRRHIYTGSIGYISFHKTMDLSVAIRTTTIWNNQIYFSVGGAIVYDSNPDDEFNETLHKGKTIMDVLSTPSHKANKFIHNYMPWVWFSGKIKSLYDVSIPIFDLGFMYGFGLFETLLVKNKKVFFLNEHIKRFNESWEQLFEIPVPDLSWNAIIKQVLEANKAKNRNIAIKIVATRGHSIKSTLFDGSIFVIAKPFKNRVSKTGVQGLKVAIYPEPRQTPLANHKTLNYLYYHLAGIWAFENGFDEALILNPDGTLSEGNSSNLILIYGNNAIIPKSKFCLPGVTVSVITEQLKKMKYNIIVRSVYPIELFNADTVFLTNSLMMILPVISVNKKAIRNNSEITKTVSLF